MACNTFAQHYADGTSQVLRRRKKQGRRSSGLGKPQLVRLWNNDEEKMKILQERFGIYWNKNEFIRNAVSKELRSSVYTELLKR
jgi:hypothetical protein